MDQSIICAFTEEIEVLQAIYGDELIISESNKRNKEIKITIHPNTADDEDGKYVCLTLHFHFTFSSTSMHNYPNKEPCIFIKNPRGLSDSHLASIEENLKSLAASMTGEQMLFSLIEYAKESLTDNNHPSCCCPICLERFEEGGNFFRTACYHYFHTKCIKGYVEIAESMICPVCRLEFQIDESFLKTGDTEEEESDVKEKFVPDADFIKWRQQCDKMYEKQRRNGGIIDLEFEKNKYLITLTETSSTGIPDSVSDPPVANSSSQEKPYERPKPKAEKDSMRIKSDGMGSPKVNSHRSSPKPRFDEATCSKQHSERTNVSNIKCDSTGISEPTSGSDLNGATCDGESDIASNLVEHVNKMRIEHYMNSLSHAEDDALEGEKTVDPIHPDETTKTSRNQHKDDTGMRPRGKDSVQNDRRINADKNAENYACKDGGSVTNETRGFSNDQNKENLSKRHDSGNKRSNYEEKGKRDHRRENSEQCSRNPRSNYRQRNDYRQRGNDERRDDRQHQKGYHKQDDYRQRDVWQHHKDARNDDRRFQKDSGQMDIPEKKTDKPRQKDVRQKEGYQQREGDRYQKGSGPTDNYKERDDKLHQKDSGQKGDYRQKERPYQKGPGPKEDYRQKDDRSHQKDSGQKGDFKRKGYESRRNDSGPKEDNGQKDKTHYKGSGQKEDYKEKDDKPHQNDSGHEEDSAQKYDTPRHKDSEHKGDYKQRDNRRYQRETRQKDNYRHKDDKPRDSEQKCDYEERGDVQYQKGSRQMDKYKQRDIPHQDDRDERGAYRQRNDNRNYNHRRDKFKPSNQNYAPQGTKKRTKNEHFPNDSIDTHNPHDISETGSVTDGTISSRSSKIPPGFEKINRNECDDRGLVCNGNDPKLNEFNDLSRRTTIPPGFSRSVDERDVSQKDTIRPRVSPGFQEKAPK